MEITSKRKLRSIFSDLDKYYSELEKFISDSTNDMNEIENDVQRDNFSFELQSINDFKIKYEEDKKILFSRLGMREI